MPRRLIGDRTYGSNPVSASLVKRGIEPIIPTRSHSTVATHQDGRQLRCYKYWWIIKHTNLWLQNFRRLVVQYERSATIFAAPVHLAFTFIILKRALG